MDETSKKVIRGAEVEGFVVCSDKGPNQSSSKASSAETSEENTLLEKNASYRRGITEGHQQGYEIGKAEGLEEGYKKGCEETKVEISVVLELLERLAFDLRAKQAEIFEDSKPEWIRLALTAAESVIRVDLAQPNQYEKLVENLLSKAKEFFQDAPIEIILSTQDYALLKESQSLEASRKIHFLSDQTIPKGNCRLETSLGLINFNIKRLLEDLEMRLLESGSES